METEKDLILVVDDDDDIRDMLVSFLELSDFDVIHASGGDEALKLVMERSDIKFAISDISMPEGDGFSFLKKIRELNPDLPFVVLYSGYSKVHKDQALEYGALDLLEKPIDPTIIAELIRKMLNK